MSTRNETMNEALYELAIDAFLEGVAETLPSAQDFGICPARQEKLVDRRVLAFITDRVA